MTSGGSNGGGGDGDMRRTRSASVSFKDIPTTATATATTTTLSTLGNTILQPQHHQQQQQQRDRGFSFECFSLGILDDDDEQTGEGFTEVTGIDVDAIHQQSMQCSSSSNNSNNSNIQRPRGDSIIFDPTSFLMGGIHETSALSSSSQKHTYNNNNIGGYMNGRYPMMTCSTGDGDIALAADAAATTTLPMFSSNYMPQPPLMHAPLAIPTIAASPSRKVKSSKRGRDSMQQLQQQQRKRGSPRRVKTRGGLEDSSGQREKNVIAALAFAVGGSNDNNNNNNNNNSNDPIIHVPLGNTNFSMSGSRMYHHGREQILSSQSHADSNYINSNRDIDRSSSSSQSTTTTTTTCPMELINKGGRVGIYLPDERRARIAKFHTKRKVRIWRKRIKYDCRKKLADSRPRIKGRFVKRSDVEECGVEGEG